MSTYTCNELKYAATPKGHRWLRRRKPEWKQEALLVSSFKQSFHWVMTDWQEEKKNGRTKCLELPIDGMTCVNQDPLFETIWSVLQNKVEALTRHWPQRSFALSNQKLQCGLRKCCGDWPAERKSITWVRVQSCLWQYSVARLPIWHNEKAREKIYIKQLVDILKQETIKIK